MSISNIRKDLFKVHQLQYFSESDFVFMHPIVLNVTICYSIINNLNRYFEWNETQTTDNTLEFYAGLMKRCWDSDPTTEKFWGINSIRIYIKKQTKEIIKLKNL